MLFFVFKWYLLFARISQAVLPTNVTFEKRDVASPKRGERGLQLNQLEFANWARSSTLFAELHSKFKTPYAFYRYPKKQPGLSILVLKFVKFPFHSNLNCIWQQEEHGRYVCSFKHLPFNLFFQQLGLLRKKVRV